jgi:hypothetical protein
MQREDVIQRWVKEGRAAHTPSGVAVDPQISHIFWSDYKVGLLSHANAEKRHPFEMEVVLQKLPYPLAVVVHVADTWWCCTHRHTHGGVQMHIGATRSMGTWPHMGTQKGMHHATCVWPSMVHK